MRLFLFQLFSILFISLIAQENILQEFVWNEHRNNPYSKFDVGVAVYHKPTKVEYRRNGSTVLDIEFKEPALVYQADTPQAWGFVQFPRIARVKKENKLVVIWNLAPDDIRSKPKIGWRYSKDNGKNWFFRWKERPKLPGLLLSNNEEIILASLNFSEDEYVKALPLRNFNVKDGTLKLYRKDNLNFRHKGFYVRRKNYSNGKEYFQLSPIANDSLILGHSFKGVLPVQAWGPVKELRNGELISVQYPVFQLKDDESIELSGIGIYKSYNYGDSWRLVSVIPYSSVNADYSISDFENRNGFGLSEPAIEVLDNGSILCVIRSSSEIAQDYMYSSISKDGGNSWSTPKAISKNGVSPQLLKLDNGVIVLSSGRPGVQIRFMDNSQEQIWTDAFEMLRFEGLEGQVSCGYTGLLSLDNNRFIIVYSDFRSRDKNNIPRKAIMVREVVVNKR